MQGREHAVMAAGAGIGVAIVALGMQEYGLAALAVPTAILGGKLPDCDHPSTKQGKVLNILKPITISASLVFTVGALWAMLKQYIQVNYTLIIIPALLLLLLTNKWFWQHRHGTHTLAFPILFAVASYVCDSGTLLAIRYALIGLNAGYLSHLYADMWTKKGDPILYPIIKKNIHFTNIKSADTGKCMVISICNDVVFIIAAILIIMK